MGFSIVLAGGITGAAMIAVFSIVFAMTAQVYEVNSSRTQSTILENLIAQTDIEIRYLNATAFDVVSFTLINTGNEKIWNYEKFNILVTYTANIGGVPTLTTEHLTYNSALAFGGVGCSQVPLGSGQWTIDKINNNLHDPRIINTDEDGKFCTKLTNNVYQNTNVTLTVSTDVGKTKSAIFTV